MNPVSIFLFLISTVLVIGSIIPDMEHCMPIAHYVMLGAILVEIGYIHESLKKEN